MAHGSLETTIDVMERHVLLRVADQRVRDQSPERFLFYVLKAGGEGGGSSFNLSTKFPRGRLSCLQGDDEEVPGSSGLAGLGSHVAVADSVLDTDTREKTDLC